MNIEYEYARDMIVVIAVGTIVTAVVVALEVAVTVSYSVDVLSGVVTTVLMEFRMPKTLEKFCRWAAFDVVVDLLMDRLTDIARVRRSEVRVGGREYKRVLHV